MTGAIRFNGYSAHKCTFFEQIYLLQIKIQLKAKYIQLNVVYRFEP